jgi:hypothetical protein
MEARVGATSHCTLLEKHLLVSDLREAPLRIAFPIDVVERWFPKLYPG